MAGRTRQPEGQTGLGPLGGKQLQQPTLTCYRHCLRCWRIINPSRDCFCRCTSGQQSSWMCWVGAQWLHGQTCARFGPYCRLLKLAQRKPEHFLWAPVSPAGFFSQMGSRIHDCKKRKLHLELSKGHNIDFCFSCS